EAGLRAALDPVRGLDHGAWVPLMLMYPDADIPVVQLSIQAHLGPGHHLQLGRALAPLRAENVLILASGSLTHNLGALRFYRGEGGEGEPDWVTDFAEWVHEAIAQSRVCDLISYRALAPHAVDNHPTDEHLLPLFVALGAGLHETASPAEHERRLAARRLHASSTFGVLRMDAYAFD
ncbi:MAG TPA: class III extradiol ring-cleavage dioxygenase, partial [Novosphingobium sp.]|nr:class III extradiol ring-cleavage dioxygenase [Novosphingobium sp.]